MTDFVSSAAFSPEDMLNEGAVLRSYSDILGIALDVATGQGDTYNVVQTTLRTCDNPEVCDTFIMMLINARARGVLPNRMQLEKQLGNGMAAAGTCRVHGPTLEAGGKSCFARKKRTVHSPQAPQARREKTGLGGTGASPSGHVEHLGDQFPAARHFVEPRSTSGLVPRSENSRPAVN